MRRKNDIVWKGVLEEVFEDMLTFVFKNARRELDFNRGFTFLDKELAEINPEPEKPSGTRFVDKLVKVYIRGGAERWLLVHVEVQGNHDPDFAERMFTYYYRIKDRYHRHVTALAIFSGRVEKGKIPAKYEYACLGTKLTYKYNVLRIMDYSNDTLKRSKNPFALVLWVAQTALLQGKFLDERILAEKLLIVKALKQRGIFTNPKIRAVMVFLNNYVLFQNQQTNRTFMDQVDNITGKKNTMGIVEQVAEMREAEALKKGQAQVRQIQVKTIRALLTETDFSVEKIAEISNASVAFVKKIKVKAKA